MAMPEPFESPLIDPKEKPGDEDDEGLTKEPGSDGTGEDDDLLGETEGEQRSKGMDRWPSCKSSQSL